ncbi:hypothetical protein I41_44110 [Lacipirellula limnantheis]|uniref:Uncharacterized protein n=1 Tax=Lacipirellula limnantheis TaxID=2528024 RepID=A0A517U3K2_9BACT|nr:hypothetical protein I41_44110 [Lacipirellula limnantheis]
MFLSPKGISKGIGRSTIATTVISNASRRPDVWVVLAELPCNDLAPVYEEIRKLRNALCRSLLASKDDAIGVYCRRYRFRDVKCSDYFQVLVNDPHCPADILFLPLTKIIPPPSN